MAENSLICWSRFCFFLIFLLLVLKGLKFNCVLLQSPKVFNVIKDTPIQILWGCLSRCTQHNRHVSWYSIVSYSTCFYCICLLISFVTRNFLYLLTPLRINIKKGWQRSLIFDSSILPWKKGNILSWERLI